MPKLSKNKKRIVFIFLIVFVLILIPFLQISAEPRFRMQTNWPTSPAGRDLTADSTITDLVAYLYEWGIALGGLIAFIALLIAGFNYLTSVGDPSKMKDSIERIKSAIFGLILLLSAFLILNTINPELTVLREIEFDVEHIPGLDPGQVKIVFDMPPCQKAILFEFADFQGTSTAKNIGDHPINPPRLLSVVFCRKKGEGEKQAEDKCPSGFIEGGDCVLQLFDDINCRGEIIVELPGPKIPNMNRVAGIQRAKCMRLIAQGTRVPIPPEPDPVIIPDPHWGVGDK